MIGLCYSHMLTFNDPCNRRSSKSAALREKAQWTQLHVCVSVVIEGEHVTAVLFLYVVVESALGSACWHTSRTSTGLNNWHMWWLCMPHDSSTSTALLWVVYHYSHEQLPVSLQEKRRR